MGFRRLHNLAHSLIHFNYLINLLCNKHNLYGDSYTRRAVYKFAIHNPPCVKCWWSCSTEERQAVLTLLQHYSILYNISKSRKPLSGSAFMCEYKLLFNVLPSRMPLLSRRRGGACPRAVDTPQSRCVHIKPEWVFVFQNKMKFSSEILKFPRAFAAHT